MEEKKEFKSFSEFYPFYLSEHSNPVNRRLHFFGCLLVILILLYAIFTKTWLALILLPIVGYGFAWIGHYFVEKNRPATFTYPLYSFMGDWVMFKDIISGKVKL
ncbi:MAG TPA: DUF962 domain-containing protein [Thermodesulfobacteriota bacterium]|nr:DUF962 domain-containing protein [Thermodesulfobacteriota bacterium]